MRYSRRDHPSPGLTLPVPRPSTFERAEDEHDVRMAEEALAELEHSPAIPWEQVKRELGL